MTNISQYKKLFLILWLGCIEVLLFLMHQIISLIINTCFLPFSSHTLAVFFIFESMPIHCCFPLICHYPSIQQSSSRVKSTITKYAPLLSILLMLCWDRSIADNKIFLKEVNNISKPFIITAFADSITTTY